MIVLIDGKEVNTFSNLSLICPYCGHSEFVSCDTFDGQTLDDTEHEFVCPKCKKSFIGERILNISYETYKCDEKGKKIDEDEFKIHGRSKEIDDSDHHGIDYNDHEYVDLGLPSGTLWAKCNVGAEKETDYGGYYQWGGIEDFTNTKKNCNWKIYPYGTSYDTPTKYNLRSEWGKVDNKTELELSDDIANQVMGGDWHIPSREQFCELVNNTTSEWITVGGVNGRRFTSKFNGQSIFIPAAGYRDYRTLLDVGDYCYLWSSSLYQARPSIASNLYFNSDDYSIEDFNRYYGFSVRGVIG